MPHIASIRAREILDSRGKPTVEAEVLLDNGVGVRASVPSGASTGAAEACELRDGNGQRYDGMGVLKAVVNVIQEIGPAVAGMNPADQAAIDERLIELDGTPQKTRLGANAILAVSLAVCRAAAEVKQVPLYRHVAALAGQEPRMPLPMTNMISGGKHAGGNLDIQDVLIIPSGAGMISTS